MIGDGNGWVHGRYWGKFGAAGLFLLIDAHVLLQHRAPWTADGGTWGIPGGARDSHETAADAALRETWEECGVLPSAVHVVDSLVTTRVPGWSYTTVLGTADRFPALVANNESAELRWVPLRSLRDSRRYPLHPGFAASLDTVLERAHAAGLGAVPAAGLGHNTAHD